MLSLWTDDGSLSVLGGTFGGNYVGNGDPGDPSTCSTPSGNAANQGTLCIFFKYVAGSFKPANKFVSLSPSYLTNFDITATQPLSISSVTTSTWPRIRSPASRSGQR